MKNLLVMLLAVPLLAGSEPAATRLEGLRDTVEILRDRWGIAHIYAQNEEDLFFAQGYNAAVDRLFQLEVWRRQATGSCAEAFGRSHVARDTAARLFRFRGDLRAELRHYHPHGESIVRSFAAGINARIAETERNPDLLPIEFRLLGLKPGLWTPEVVVSRHSALLANAAQELSLGRAVAKSSADRVRELLWLRPGRAALDLDPSISPSVLDANILELYTRFRQAVAFEPEGPAVRSAGLSDMKRALAPSDGSFMWREGVDVGSNNWTVSGRLTHSGMPVLANDPHRAITVPSLRYWVHLVAPGWNVIGAGEPAIPGVSVGHNEEGAWGITVFGQDTEDIYVYETNAANPFEYRYKGAWEEMQVVRDTVRVKGESPAAIELRFTRHGPVIFEDAKSRVAIALRAAWLETGGAPYLASLRTDQAGSWEAFREACSYARIPALNWVWADRAGNIGYQAASISPVRRGWDGLVPVPGDGRFEWDGFLPVSLLPSAANPEKGYWGTANNFQLPPGYSHLDAVHRNWGDEVRGARLDEALASGRRFTVPDMMRLQHDELSLPARSIVPFLRWLEVKDEAVRKARDLLLGWDFVLDRDSVPAGIYIAFERRLVGNIRDVVIPAAIRNEIGAPNMKRVVDWVAAPDGRFGADPLVGRDALLLRSLDEGVKELTRKLGTDMAEWKYGQEKYKHALIRHPLSAFVSPELRQRLDVGPAPRGGSASTLNAAGARDVQDTGASFRIVADTGNWDNSVGTNTPGQSGDPSSPHYRDLFDLWSKNRYFPVFFGRNRIESVTEAKQLLEPPERKTGSR